MQKWKKSNQEHFHLELKYIKYEIQWVSDMKLIDFNRYVASVQSWIMNNVKSTDESKIAALFKISFHCWNIFSSQRKYSKL